MAGTVDEKQRTALLHDAETRAYPAIFRGLINAWPAVALWKGPQGLSYLKAAAGHATVQAMYAPSSNFCGDIQQHQSVACTLGELLDIAAQQQQQQQQQQDEAVAAGGTSAGHIAAAAADQADAAAAAAASSKGCADMHLYLAQQSLFCPGLSTLLADTPTPNLLQQKQLTAINLWFSSRPSRSSTHYDPYQNLLCVVTGTKRLKLFRPDAGLGLYPKALGGEASNHSNVDFATPNLAQHPLYRHVLDQALDVTLNPGDALFIPEGWWHQVDSDSLTFAVNFWWQSDLTAQLRSVPHQHHYYLRQLLASTSSEVVQLLLAGIKPWTPPIDCKTATEAQATAAQADETAGAAAVAEKMQATAAAPTAEAAAAPGDAAAPQGMVSGKTHVATAAARAATTEETAAAAAAAAATQEMQAAAEGRSVACAVSATTARAAVPSVQQAAVVPANAAAATAGEIPVGHASHDTAPWRPAAAAAAAGGTVEHSEGNSWARTRKRRRCETDAIAEQPTALTVTMKPSTLTTPQPQSATAVAAAGGACHSPVTVGQQAKHAQHLSLSPERQLAAHGAGISDPAQSSTSCGSSAGCSGSSGTNSTSSGTSRGSSSSGSGSSSETSCEQQGDIVVQLNQLKQAALQELQDAIRSEVPPAVGTADEHYKIARLVEACQHSSHQPQQKQQQQQHRHGIVQEVAEAERVNSSAAGDDPVLPQAASAAAGVSVSGVLVSSSWLQQQQMAQQQLLWEAVSQSATLRATTADDDSLAPTTADDHSLPHRADKTAHCSCSRRTPASREGTKPKNAAGEAQCSALGLNSRFSSLLAALEPVQLLRMLWVAAGPAEQGGCKDVVQMLLQQGLTPVVAHMLTQMFEQGDEHFAHDAAFGSQAGDGPDQGVVERGAVQKWTAQQHAMDMQLLPFTREQFYGRLYGAVPDTGAVLHCMIAGKATLTLAAANLIVQCHVNTTV